jgi:hypothetical protein
MFLRPNRRSKDGKDHNYWSLVETVRTPDGPRQKTLCYLGELNSSAQGRWLKTIEVFNEQGEAQQLKLFPSQVEPPADDPQVARVLLNKVRLERTRQFGACWLGLELWRRLELDRFFKEAVDEQEADVPWSRVAAVLAINRLCAPGSELAIEQRWYPSTALDDLLGIEEGKINDTRLYRCLDRILPHKTKLERHLKQRYGELFGAEFDVLLYDLTSSYVEGAAEKNPMMRRGYSRDHRPDCEQMVIALIVNTEGFPFSYETFDGNRADVSTMETILRMVERKYGKARRIWVFDRGIVSEENLQAIRKRGGQYLVGTPRSQMKQFEEELLKDDWTQVRPEVGVKEGRHSARRGDIYPVPHQRPEGKREGHPEPLLRSPGRRFEAPSENHRERPTERPPQNGAAPGADSGQPSPGERSLRRRCARYTQGCSSPLGDQRRSKDLACTEGRRLHAPHQSPDRYRRRALEPLYAVDRGRGIVPRAQKRTLHPALVSSIGAAGQGACDGRLPGLRPVGHAQVSAEAPARHRPAAILERRQQCAAVVGHEGACSALYLAECRHRSAHHRRTRDPSAPHHRTHHGAEITSTTARAQPPRTVRIQSQM